MKYQIKLENVDIDEYFKVIGFISEDIKSIERNDDVISVEIDGSNKEQVLESIKQEAKKYISNSKIEKCYFENKVAFTNHEIYSDDIKKITDGSIVLNGKAIFLYNFFDECFEKIAYSLGAIPKQYPVLLPIDTYIKTGYLRRSPQYSIFCSPAKEEMSQLDKLDEEIANGSVERVLNKPHLALSPSACFHTYLEYENKTLEAFKIVTFVQSVFRNEGRFNYFEAGRLMDYHVREIVAFGNNEDINSFRMKMIDLTINLLKELELNSKISIASDSFVMPKMQKFKKIQVMEASKYELKLSISNEKEIAGGSFNLHGKAFTEPFNISVDGVEDAVSACVGFGIERWVLAFVGQYGLDEKKWPKTIKEKYYGRKTSSIR